MAAEYLEQQGFQILEQNFRSGRGEIDVICIREGLLVFVEVKSRSQGLGFRPNSRVSSGQQKKIQNTAWRYMRDYTWYGLVRFDMIEVILNNGVTINHHPGYFL